MNLRLTTDYESVGAGLAAVSWALPAVGTHKGYLYIGFFF